VNLRKKSTLTLEVVNLMGQTVYRQLSEARPGMNTFTIEAGNLVNGVYFYTIKAGSSSVTKKMIVE
jgi:hypothetical protein